MPHGWNSIYKDSFSNCNNDENDRFIAEIADGTLIGYKYFDFTANKKLAIAIRGTGEGFFDVSDECGSIGKILVVPSEKWTEASCELDVSEGVHSVFLKYSAAVLLI